MKAFYFLAASCFLCTALAAEPYWRARKHHKAATTVQEFHYNPEANTMPQGVELEYWVPEPAEDAAVFGGAPLNAPFPPDTVPSSPNTWTKVGFLDMTDPMHQCPAPWLATSSVRASCGKRTPGGACDSLPIRTSGASYQTVCGRFRGYQIGTPDAFYNSYSTTGQTVEGNYVDGISITYGLPGSRQHIFTYAAGISEFFTTTINPQPFSKSSLCPCAGGMASRSFVGSNYTCESGNPNPTSDGTMFYYSDILWDGRQCGGLETTCCSAPNLAWFCTTFPTPVSGDIEIRLCMDEAIGNENIALEFFELYIK